MALADRIIRVESGGNANARNPLSSAGGAGQFIDSTWLSMLRQHRPDLAAGKSDADLLALKSDAALSRDMTTAYAADNAGILSRAGLPVTDGTQYLAHFAGPGGAVGLLHANPAAPAASVLGAGFAKANPTMANMSAGDVIAWADRKMGGASSAPMSIAGPAAAGGGKTALPAAPQPAAPAIQQAAAAAAPAVAPAATSITPQQIEQLAAVPQGQSILPARKIYAVRGAPFSLGGGYV